MEGSRIPLILHVVLLTGSPIAALYLHVVSCPDFFLDLKSILFIFSNDEA